MIHPTAILDGDIDLGQGVEVGPYAVLRGPLEVGAGTRIGAHTALGGFADELGARGPTAPNGPVRIGANVLIREFVSVHHPFATGETRIADDAYLMHGAYVAHDAFVGPRATLAQNAAMGGFSAVLEGSYVAMGASVVQRVVVGSFAIVAAASAAIRSVPPFTRAIPGRPAEVNGYALERYGYSDRRAEIEAFVLSGTRPSDAALISIVTDFEHYVGRSRDAG